ncbi:unnamed protein product [Ilex paraguariensis]|uniref:Plastid lipid-associated protein/fibrillin conserved domain-containing protein n=1 Tax=Ilex paraguariensis TaxID=185542 RepID=A0ABC8V1T2_9AQUA
MAPLWNALYLGVENDSPMFTILAGKSVQFKEGTLKPPEIKSSVDLPESIDLFGQKINLSPARQVVNPLQDAVAGIARSISGQSPLKIPIPGERAASWLLVTYLDKDLRISRGDGGLFVLAKEGSPLLDQ